MSNARVFCISTVASISTKGSKSSLSPLILFAEIVAFIDKRNIAIKPKQIALGFQFEQDDTGRKTWLYWVTVNRPQKEATTIEDNIEVNTYSMAYEARPRLDDKDTMAYMRLDPTLITGNQAAYDAFFDAVYVEVPIA